MWRGLWSVWSGFDLVQGEACAVGGRVAWFSNGVQMAGGNAGFEDQIPV